MSRIIVFGAGGRAGRTAVREARSRGHEVTAVVRDPAKHPDLDAVAGDVLDAESVATLSAGHDAAISSVYDFAVEPAEFFTRAAQNLVENLAADRLLVVGLASVLATASGGLLMDRTGYPQEYRSFYLGHAAGMEVLRAADRDWLVVSPSGDFDHEGGRTGHYRVAPADASSRISYADHAIALVDEVETPKHHRTHIGVEQS
jgi:putative NADH-flavin reductase